MPDRAPRPSRDAFCEFLALLATGVNSSEQWSTHVVEHYPDDQVESERRKLVRAAIAAGNQDSSGVPMQVREAASAALVRLRG